MSVGTGWRRRDIMRGTIAAGAAGALFSQANPLVAKAQASDRTTTIINARIFDGRWRLAADTVTFAEGRITAVGRGLPQTEIVVDARGGTLLPGLIDAHTHTSPEALAFALRFGVTTELEMKGLWTPERRRAAAGDPKLADFRTALLAVTRKNGHPAEILPPGHPLRDNGLTTPAEARAHVTRVIEQGADYIKIMIENGDVLGHPGLPVLAPETIRAAVDEAHRHGKLALAHAMSTEATRQAIDCGVDGLTHLLIDRVAPPDIVRDIAARRMFVIPCTTISASILGGTGAALADDQRVASRLDKAWLDTLRASMGGNRTARIENVLVTIRALKDAGVTVLVGSDASFPVPTLGGVAHGASVHGEMHAFVRAGFTPAEALAATTSETAGIFGLSDRGRIAPGARADLLLVRGDPMRTITDSLSIERVWKTGVELTATAAKTSVS